MNACITCLEYFKRIFLLLIMGSLLTACGGGSGSNQATLSSSKNITAFSLNGAAGVITGQNVSVTVPYGTAVNSLVATFTITGAKVTVGGVAQISGTTANDFTSPVTYVVTATDGSTASYTVNVTVASSSAKAITAFSLNGTAGVIAGQNIAVTMPYGTAVNHLVATYTTTGASVSANGISQVSGASGNDFTSPVTYVVTAADGSTASYTVTVTVAPSSAKAITAFSLNGTAGTISGQSIAVTVPYGTAVNDLVATFTTTGTRVAVGGTGQVSGTTVNDFTNPVTYAVTAADGSATNYTVSVAVAPSSAKAITAFSINGVSGTIVGTSITVMAPALSLSGGFAYCGTTGTPEVWGIVMSFSFANENACLTPFNGVATFTTTGASVSVSGVTQVSGNTINAFVSETSSGTSEPVVVVPVVYTVTAADGTSQNYTVQVVPTPPVQTPAPMPGLQACGAQSQEC